MKNIFKFLLVLTLIISTVSCRDNRQPYHNVVYNAQGEQMVRVQDYDQNGNLIEYFIAYSLFNQLYNNGGYRSVNTYYYNNRPTMDRYYDNYERGYSYDRNPRQSFVNNTPATNNNTTYRKSAPKSSNTYYSAPESKPSYRASAPTNTVVKPTSSVYRTSAPAPVSKPVTYRTSAPSSSSSYKSTSTYKPSSSSYSSSSYRSSTPSSSYKSSSSSSYRSSAPSSSYKSSSSSSSSSRSSSSSYRSSAPRH